MDDYNVLNGLDELCNGSWDLKKAILQEADLQDNLNDLVTGKDDALPGFLLSPIPKKKNKKKANAKNKEPDQIKEKTPEPETTVPSPPKRRRSLRGKKNVETENLTQSPQPEIELNESVGRTTRRSTQANRRKNADRGNNVNNVTVHLPSASNTSAQATPQRRGRRKKQQPTAPSNQPSVAQHFGVVDSGVVTTRGRGRARARRNAVAELTSRSEIVDFVDLVSSPLVRVEGMVNLDSDELDKSDEDIDGNNKSLECSFDEDNPEVSVKIKWMGGNTEVFPLRRHQKFLHIFSMLAKRENVKVENLVLNLNNRIISSNDTPDSIDYKIYQFITGRVVAENFVQPATVKKRDANTISVKIQSELWPKRPLKVEILKTNKFKILYIKCSEELGIPCDDLKLSFDGEILEFNATPIDCDFEGGEVIDLRVRK